MRRVLVQTSLLMSATAFAAGCYDDLVSVYVPPAPTGLSYQLEPSGDPLRPRGIVLRWTPVDDNSIESYNIYSRASQSGSYGLRGSTSSPSFHDDGQPHLEYYVTAVSTDGGESDPSSAVLVDERLRLPAPATLTSISLSDAIHLQWSDNPFATDPQGFSHYRVYSTSYDVTANLCGASWSLEGTTVAATFLAANLTNGRPQCFGVSAATVEGFESLWSPLRYDTPRPDGRNVILFAPGGNLAADAFRFFLDVNGNGSAEPGELGRSGSRTDLNNDFYVARDTSGAIFIVPQRLGTTMQLYGNAPVADLTSVDIAPGSGYSRDAFEAVPLWAYVFQMVEGSGLTRYGAIRVTAVGTDYVIFDWSHQTDPGNPELVRFAGGSGQ